MNEKEILEKVLEEMKKSSGESVTLEDAKAAYDFIKDQTDFDLCQVIAEAIAGNADKLEKIKSHAEKMNKMPLYIAGGVLLAAAAVVAAPAVLAALPVLSGGAAAGGTAVIGATAAPLAIGTTTVVVDGVTVAATVEAAAATTALATTTGTALATTAGTALAATEGLTVVAGGLTAGTQATIAAAGAVTAAGVGSAVTKKAATTTAAVATVGVSKALNKKNIIGALSTTLLIADICEAVKDVAYYDVAINQGNAILLEANHKVNPIFEEVLWEIPDYDTQLYFINTELVKYASDKEKIIKSVKKDIKEAGSLTSTYSTAVVIYINIVTNDNKMFMYVLMLNNEWFKTAAKTKESENVLDEHCREVLEKHNIDGGTIEYISMSSGITKIVNEDFLNGKKINEPISIFEPGSRLRIPDLKMTNTLTKATEGDAAVQNTIIGGVITNLSCEYVLNNIDKEATIYKFTTDVKSARKSIYKTSGMIELSPMLCNRKKIRVTISKLSDKIGFVDSIGIMIIPEIGTATINVLSGENVNDKIVEGKIDGGLIAAFTSAAGVSLDSNTVKVKNIYLFWTLLGGKVAEGKEEVLTMTSLGTGSYEVYNDKDGRKFCLGSDRIKVSPNKCKLKSSYLSEDEGLRLTYRTIGDLALFKEEGAINTLNSFTKPVGQGTFLSPENKIGKSDVLNKVKALVETPSLTFVTVIVHSQLYKVCHLFDYYIREEGSSIGDEELKEFAEFPFIIDGAEVEEEPDNFSVYCF